MKKTLILGLSCLLLFFASSAFALEKGRIKVVINNGKQEAISEFHYYNTQDFLMTVKQTRDGWKKQGYKCSVEKTIYYNNDFNMSVTMHCKEK